MVLSRPDFWPSKYFFLGPYHHLLYLFVGCLFVKSQFDNLSPDHVSESHEEEEFMSLLESHDNFSQNSQDTDLSSHQLKNWDVNGEKSLN